MKKWQKLYSRLICDHPFMKIQADSVILPNGMKIPDYSVWLSGNVIQAVPITKTGNYILVKQYKHGIEDFIVEFPGGFVEQGEDQITALKRELAEETGYTFSTKPKKLITATHHPTKETGKVSIYLCTDVEKMQGKKPAGDETECIEVIEWSREEFEKYLFSSEYVQSGTMLGYLLSLRDK